MHGISIPEKSAEIQAKIVQDLIDLTGLHVRQVHVVFKKLIAPKQEKEKAFTEVPVEEYASAL